MSNLYLKVESVSSYPGCKAWCANELLELMSDDMTTHVEPFGGVSKTLMLSTCKHRVYNDLSAELYTLMACLSIPQLARDTLCFLCDIPYSVEAFQKAKETAKKCDGTLNPYLAANVWATLLQSMNGDRKNFKPFFYNGGTERYEKMLLRKNDCIDFLEGMECRKEQADVIIAQYKNDPHCFMPVDPPYYGIKGLYQHEFSDYKGLATSLKDSKAKVVLFDYKNPYYDKILLSEPHWHKSIFKQSKRSMRIGGVGESKSNACEIIWHNFEIPHLERVLTNQGNGVTITSPEGEGAGRNG